MKPSVILIFFIASFTCSAGPRVVGNGFLPEKEMTLSEIEIKLNSAKDELEKFEILSATLKEYSSEKFIITSENNILVTQLAKRLLTLSSKFKNNFGYGNAIHHAYLALGRTALFNGDTKTAERNLIDASHVKATPQLKSFGPNMTLAKELLILDRKDVVIRYIDTCHRFWNKGVDTEATISSWKRAIRNGEIPNFKGNLDY